MIWIIAKTIGSVQPHGEPIIIYRTFDYNIPELERWLLADAREVVAVEVRLHETAITSATQQERK